MPAYLVEAHYDLEKVGDPPDFGTPAVLRREEYWTMLTGGTGQFYGNLYTWSFKDGWRNNIDTPGADRLTIWRDFFSAVPWQGLVPDQNHSVLTYGFGNIGDMSTSVSESEYATAASTSYGSVIIAYMPTARSITVNMAHLRSPAKAQWFDPSNGAYTAIQAKPFPNRGTQNFMPPAKNHDGDSDWVLLLTASQ